MRKMKIFAAIVAALAMVGNTPAMTGADEIRENVWTVSPAEIDEIENEILYYIAEDFDFQEPMIQTTDGIPSQNAFGNLIVCKDIGICTGGNDGEIVSTTSDHRYINYAGTGAEFGDTVITYTVFDPAEFEVEDAIVDRYDIVVRK